jgi:hypothetical protein
VLKKYVARHGKSCPLLKVVVAVITLGVARKAEDGVELALARTWPFGAGRIPAETMFLVHKVGSVVDSDLVAGCDRLRQHQDRLAHRCTTVVPVGIPCESRICLSAGLVVRVLPWYM